jgi:hypothetical protein
VVSVSGASSTMSSSQTAAVRRVKLAWLKAWSGEFPEARLHPSLRRGLSVAQNEADGGARWAPIQLHFRGKRRVDTAFSGVCFNTPLLETLTSRPAQNVSVPRRLAVERQVRPKPTLAARFARFRCRKRTNTLRELGEGRCITY